MVTKELTNKIWYLVFDQDQTYITYEKPNIDPLCYNEYVGEWLAQDALDDYKNHEQI